MAKIGDVGYPKRLGVIADALDYTGDSNITTMISTGDIQDYALDSTANPESTPALRLSALLADNKISRFNNYDGRTLKAAQISILIVGGGDPGDEFEITVCKDRLPDTDETWVATESETWITALSPSTGSGAATVAITADINNTGSTRYGTINVEIDGWYDIDITVEQPPTPTAVSSVSVAVDDPAFYPGLLITTLTYNNSGGAGDEFVDWELYNSGNTLIDSDTVELSFVNGNGETVAITGITAPAVGTGYYLKAKMSDEGVGDWKTSNTFDVEAMEQ